jgi:hypothetical protein
MEDTAPGVGDIITVAIRSTAVQYRTASGEDTT